MPGRKFGNENRYGFNSKERDKDLHNLTAYDYGFRVYNPAIGKFLSVDPLMKTYPWYTPYQFAGNMPIWAIDLDGKEMDLNTLIVVQNRGTTKFQVLGDVTVKIQILNLSSLANKDINLANYGYDIGSSMQDLLNKSQGLLFDRVNTNFEVKPSTHDIGTTSNRETQWESKLKFTSKTEVITDRSQIRNDAFLFVLVDDYEPRPSKDIKGNPIIHPVGVGGTGVASIKASEKYGGNQRLQTAMHELGHAMGLRHYWNETPGDRSGKNLMEYYGNANMDVTATQLKEIFSNYGLNPYAIIEILKDSRKLKEAHQVQQRKHENDSTVDGFGAKISK